MFKKTLVFSLAVALMLTGLCNVASAAQNVTNVSQKGSLLIFPKIDTSLIVGATVPAFRDTIVMIANDYYTEQWIKCYWVNAEQEIQDFMFLLTPNQPIWFRASDGLGTGSWDDPYVNYPVTMPPFFPGDNTTGELKCWAVDPAGATQVAFNHLYGNAMIVDTFHAAAFEYNAWAFTARGVAQGAPVGDAGTLVLSGSNGAYDACPQYMLFNFFSVGSSISFDGATAYFRETDLTLIPCIQDLRQDRVPTCTKAKFDIWNENETKYTGAYRCIKCWFEGYLDQIDVQKPGKGFGGEKFTYKALHTTAGRFRATGVASTVCNNVFKTPDTVYGPGKDKCTGGQVASPLLGLINTEISFVSAPFDALAGTTGNHAGVGASSTIKWDTQAEPPQAPGR
jgi:hypothetical protein